MWIISTFEPGFYKKTLKSNIEIYGEDRVICIKKSKFFLWINVIIPLSFWTTILLLALIFTIPNMEVTWLLWLLIFLYVFVWAIPISKVIKYYLDYKMDFVIVNPRSFIRYNQEWFFKRITKTIDLKKIRSISTNKKWFINSIFNNGTLVVLSEWWEVDRDEQSKWWEITFRYVYNPEFHNQQIDDLFNKVFGQKII